MHYVKHAAPLSKTLREKNGGWLVNWRPLLHNQLAAVQGSSGTRPIFIPPMRNYYCYYFFLVIVFAGTDWFSSLGEAAIVAREFLLWFTTRLQNTVQPWLKSCEWRRRSCSSLSLTWWISWAGLRKKDRYNSHKCSSRGVLQLTKANT